MALGTAAPLVENGVIAESSKHPVQQPETNGNTEQQPETNGNTLHTKQELKRDPDGFLRRPIQDLFSLAERTIVITGGARGIGLAFAFAVAEAGGSVAILDISEEPHPHFLELVKRFPEQRFKLYK